MTDEQTPEAAAQQEGAPQFGLVRIFVKDLSFEAPQGAKAFTQQFQPKVNQDLNTQVSKLDDKHYEVVLKLTVTVSSQEDKTMFLAEVHQAGIFAVAGVEGVQLQHVLTSGCPQILFPYAREAVDNMVVRGGFPALALPPVNFDALFAQAVAQAKEQQEQNGESPSQETH